jgi:hypothetical protein
MNDHSNLPASMQDGGPKTLSHLAIGSGVSAIIPKTFEEVYRFAGLLAASGLAPYGMNTPEKCAVALLTGMELGLKPMQAIQSIAVINGRPTVWGDAAMAMVRATGQLEDFEEEFTGTPYDDDYTAHCTIKRKGEKPVKRSFSVKQAKTAKLWMKKGGQNGDKDTPWVTFPDRMLMRRARSQATTDAFQDVLKGMSIAEDLQEVLDVTPTAAAPAAPVAAERPKITRGKKAQDERGATPDQMEAAARVAVTEGPETAAANAAMTGQGAVVVDEAHTTKPETVDEAIENRMSDASAEKAPQAEGATQHDQQGDGDFDDGAEVDWDEVKQHFKADLLACTDVGSCEAALEGLLGRHDGMPADVERVVCETHDERVKQIAEAAQLRLAAEQKKAAEKVTDRAVAERAADANEPKKTFASTAEAEKAIEGVLSKLRMSKSTQQLQGVWDSHVVPFMAEYNLAASDIQGIEQVFNARKKILARKEG